MAMDSVSGDGADLSEVPDISGPRVLDLTRRGSPRRSAGDVSTVDAGRERAAAARDRRAAARDLARATAYLRVADLDELTGALQRWPGMVALRRAVNHAQLAGWSLMIAFLDVDGLKQVNDRHGHAAGDELLRAVGSALRTSVRAEDLVIRYGGDEFVCVLDRVDLHDALHRIDEMHLRLVERVPDRALSFGLAELRRDDCAEDVVDRADREMYAKRASRRS
jgi:diguanylate cyclase (GGDEF)-like protein